VRQRRLNLGLVTFVAVATDDQCIACPEQAAWLFEFNEKTRWWHQARFGLCLGCIEGADDDEPVAEPVGPVDYHGWVYFIRAGEFVKIGYSIEPAKRLGHLATASPLPLELWAKTRGNPVDERALHRRFARDRAHGEWFRVSDRIRNFVASIGGAA
jgi:hypothetical protein